MNTQFEPSRAGRSGLSPRFVGMSILGVAAVAALAWAGLALSPAAESKKSFAGEPQAASKGRQQANDLSMAFKEVAKKVRPAVVNIRATKNPAEPVRGNQRQMDPRMREFMEFFGDSPFGRFMQPGDGSEGFQQWGGSGVIVSDDGYIITNNHVVGKADDLKVTLEDDRSFKAKLVGRDERTDLAILKIDAKDLPHAPLGDSEKMEVGDWVVAIGSPFGLSETVTSGIISAKGRSISGDREKIEDYIQTDAAINQGNSGGPLVNLDGEVIGINTAILSGMGGTWTGIGFAVPSKMAAEVKDSIVQHGRMVRGWIGVAIQNLNEDMARSFKFEGTKGVLVGEVTEGTPAAKAGLRDGDIITSFDEKPVHSVDELRGRVGATAPGKKVPMDIFRDGKTERLMIEVAEREAQTASAPGAPAEDEPASVMGVELQTLTADIASRIGVDAEEGVLVANVNPGSIAAEAGLRRGDVVLRVEGEKVTTAEQMAREIKKLDLKKGIRLQVVSQGMKGFVFVKDGN